MEKSLKTERCFFQSSSFRNTPFVKAIRKEFGSKGYVLILATLEEICSSGIEVSYDQSFFDRVIATYPEMSKNLIDMVVRKMIKKGFLDRDAFFQRQVLMPPSCYIVDTVEEIYDDRNSGKPYLFIRSSIPGENSCDNRMSVVSSEETPINSEETGVNRGFSGNYHVQPQI